MSSPKVGFKNSLLQDVILPHKCTSCGACVITCPFRVLESINGQPSLINDCHNCGICTQACPRYNWRISEGEEFVFSRQRTPNEAYGVFRRVAIAKAKLIQGTFQDGGIASALLIAALQQGLISGAVVTAKSEGAPFLPIPIVATNSKQIIESAGTKYTCSSSLLAMREAANLDMAFVGTPCQVQAIRKMQINNLKQTNTRIKYLVGLMCSECFDYNGLMEDHIKGKLGIRLEDITKMNIKGKMLINTCNGATTTIPLSEIKPFTRSNCSFCEDFSSELADISLGGLGLDGWTFVIIRTAKGEKLFENAKKIGLIEEKELEKDSFPERLLLKLSKKKYESAKRDL